MQLAASALLLLPGAPPLEDAVGFGRDEVAGEAGHRDRRAGVVQGEVDLARWRVALEHRLQVGLELALGFGVRFVGLHRARVRLRAGSARASGASSARWEGVGAEGWVALTIWNVSTLESTVVLDAPAGAGGGGAGGTAAAAPPWGTRRRAALPCRVAGRQLVHGWHGRWARGGRGDEAGRDDRNWRGRRRCGGEAGVSQGGRGFDAVGLRGGKTAGIRRDAAPETSVGLGRGDVDAREGAVDASYVPAGRWRPKTRPFGAVAAP